ncbi:MAG: hypothetical protein QOH37_1144 [Nocardioidaceae bacterium]|jgi:hypothetical protein|nr:hypothetical protein [Nocardioidaceae bacterium]
MAGKTDDASGGTTEDEPTEQTKTRTKRTVPVGATVNKVRDLVAQAIWIVCVLAALVLAVAALCIALKANADNGLVKFFVDTADKLDFGVFSRGKDGVAHFKGHTHAADTKNALINWGLAAVVWLVGGRIVERVVRP